MDKTNTIVEGAEEELDNSTYENDEDVTEVDYLDTEKDENAEPNEISDDDDDLTYDDEGNVLIPDENEDEELPEGEPTDENGEKNANTVPETSKKADEPSNTKEKNDEVENLKSELERLKRQGRAALKSLGVENDDVLDGLYQLAAEVEGVPKEEYIKHVNDEENARRQEQLTFEEVAKADLAKLKAKYPACASYSSITDMPNVKRFAELREIGLNAEEAFAAANLNLIHRGEKTVKGSKSHLQSVVPKGAAGKETSIPREEFRQFKELFPELSNKELIKLYNDTKFD